MVNSDALRVLSAVKDSAKTWPWAVTGQEGFSGPVII